MLQLFYYLKKTPHVLIYFLLISAIQSTNFAQAPGKWLDLDTVKAGEFDTGKMWTFEYPPTEYFEEEYAFRPDEEWYENVRMSALRFATYCSASFVSEDGLVMTNHHCGQQSVTQVTTDGEDLHENGFIAKTLEDERPVPGLFVDQLVMIEDVSDEIHEALENAITERQQIEFESEKISEIEKHYAEDTGLYVSVTPIFYGGKYSLYGYNRYEDVRLVFAPELQAGSFGGDPDNFTYPRYNLDCAFFRVYDDNGEPLKTEHYLKWSREGIQPGEAVFVVGNPGSTNRLKTVAQLEYNRDVTYPRTISLINGLIETYKSMIENDPERKFELNDRLLLFENSLKAYSGMLKGLRDPVLMQRKMDFEKNFKNAIQSDANLKSKYGELWDKIESARSELKNYSNERYALNLGRFTTPQYFYIAEELISIAEELKLPESDRSEMYSDENLDNTLEALLPEDFDYEMNNKILEQKINVLYRYLGENNELLQMITAGNKGEDAVKYMLANSSLANLEDLKSLVSKGPDAILSSDDPFIYFVLNSAPRSEELNTKMDELTDLEDGYNQQLGRAVFEVYGTSIPPDATFTLRISDGVVKGFPYNGTVAPPFTTYYGMYNRFYSHGKEFPWNLHERWLNPPTDFDLSTPLNFVCTADVIGGASGSPVINKDAEIVGVAFDGNIQSLPGDFIYRTEENRSVSVHSDGMMEAITKIYKIERLAYELENGKMLK
jgi:hypothetical protein